MNTPKNKSTRTAQNSFTEGLLESYRKREKERLFHEARKPSTEIPLLQVDGVLMDPEESLNYLKLRLEAFQRAKEHEESIQMICPTCGNFPSK